MDASPTIGSPAAGVSRVRAFLFQVRPGEGGRFAFFFTLAALLGTAQSIGVIGSESLFLATRGAEALPGAFVLASLVTMAGTLVYASGVDRFRNDGYLVVLLVVGAAALLLGPPSIEVASRVTAIFCFYFLTDAVLTNHYWAFAWDYFDTRSSQRVFPLLAVGNSVGGLVGAAVSLVAVSRGEAAWLVPVWAAMLVISAVLVASARGALRRWGPLELEEADETSVTGMLGALRYTARSRLAQWLVASTIGMVLAVFIGQYLYSAVFVERFPEADDLVGFLGTFLIVANGIEIVLEAIVVPLLIARGGVAVANLVHPTVTLLTFGALAIDPRLWAAIAARANAELLESAMAEPLRNLVYNALPIQFRGRVRALLEGIVLYAAMALAGLLLLAFQDRISFVGLCGVGFVCGLLYLAANLRVRRAYLEELVGGLRAGTLDVAALDQRLGALGTARIAELWDALVGAPRREPTRSDLTLAEILVEREASEPIRRDVAHANPRVRAACVRALARSAAPEDLVHVQRALLDPDPSVRTAALDAWPASVALEGSALEPLLTDAAPSIRARGAQLAGARGRALLERMMRDDDPEVAVPALRAAHPRSIDTVIACADSAEPVVRGAALEALAELASPPPLPLERIRAELAHRDAVVREAATRLVAARGDDAAADALAAALVDPVRAVRERASEALVGLGERALVGLPPILGATALHACESAAQVLGAIGGAEARGLLRQELRRRVHGAWTARLAARTVDRARAPHLALALSDLERRSRRAAFALLENLEDPKVVQPIDRALRFAGARMRGDALEVVSHLGDREVGGLLAALLEDPENRAPAPARLDDETTLPADGDRSGFADFPDPWVRRGHAADYGEGDPEMEGLLLLRQVPLFEQLQLDQLEAIQQRMDENHFLAGEVVVQEGTPGDRLYVLIEGAVTIHRDWDGPAPVELGTQGPISAFGEISILDGRARSATIVAAEDTRLLSLDGTRLKELVLQMPEIAFDFFRVLGDRIREGDARFARMAAAGNGGDGAAV